jgi:long-chain acyl-CoA synthetase
MHPARHAETHPDKAAIIVAETGAVTTYAELNAASNRVAQLFRSRGLQIGDAVAIMVENDPQFYAMVWGAQRAGLRFVCMSTKLTFDEASYIIENSGAKLLIASAELAALAERLAEPRDRYVFGGTINGYAHWEDAVAAMTDTPIADERAGTSMLYSSGTTGRPKGVRLALPENPAIDGPNPLMMLAQGFFRVTANSIYLSPAPLYHAAPLGWSMAVQRIGATVVLMKKFDPDGALAAIETYRVTSSQWVPTHFVRMLKMPDAVRARYDVSSLDCAIHAAAPCPIPVKSAMIDWWGPVLEEYYAGSEGNGMTYIGSNDWLTHKGSVGRAIFGTVHICDDDGNPVPPRTEGMVFFEGQTNFEWLVDARRYRLDG